jgi:hypothetical protein
MKHEEPMPIKTGYAQQWNDTEFRGITLLQKPGGAGKGICIG